MKLVINIRGINASGKSTAVREFCKEKGLQPDAISFRGKKYRVMRGGGVYVIGWYKPFSNSEGGDALDVDKEEFKRFFRYFLTNYCPKVVVYEKQIWSTTYKLTSELRKIAMECGYGFAALCMTVHYEEALNRLFERNGGNIGNLENYDARFTGVYRSRKELLKNGVILYDADICGIPKEKMGEVIPSVIDMYKQGRTNGEISCGKNG